MLIDAVYEIEDILNFILKFKIETVTQFIDF